MKRNGPATKSLRKHLASIGYDPRAWSAQQRDTHSQLSDAAMREQNGRQGRASEEPGRRSQ